MASSSSFSSKYEDTGKQLGKGQYGTAWLVKSKATGELLVMKRFNVRLVDKDELKYAKLEIVALQKLNHPNVVRYIDSHEHPDHFSIVMEFASGGTMGKEIDDRKKLAHPVPFPDHQVFQWGGQLLSAIDYIHQQRIMHRDIKPDNVFLSGERDVKLGDFGVVKMSENGSLRGGTLMGTPAYMALEIFIANQMHDTYSAKVDEWSTGIVIFELATLERPFNARNMNELIKNLQGRKLAVPLNAVTNPEIFRIVDGLLKKNPEERFSARQALDSSAQFREHDPLIKANKSPEVVSPVELIVKLKQLTVKDNYQELEDIGTNGTFGKATVVRQLSDGRASVLKACQPLLTKNTSTLNKLKNEINAVSKLKHPQLIVYKSQFETPSGEYFVRLEFFRHRSLAYSIERRPRQAFIDENIINGYCAQLCLALKFLHSRNVAHRDVKPSNIFLKDGLNNIKLGDFGIAKQLLGASTIIQSYKASAPYLAPELLSSGANSSTWSSTSDMFALGCVLYELATLSKAFAADGRSQLTQKDKSVIVNDMKKYSSSLSDLVANLLSYSPSQRKTADDVLQIPNIREQAQKFS